MTYADGSREVIDRRCLRTLGEVHDVRWKPKSGLYANGSDRSVVNELIVRGFLKESPVEFSNRRNISITDRGRVLYDALLVVRSIWESEPDARLGFSVSGGASEDDDGNLLTETAQGPTNDPSEVSQVVQEEKAPQNGGKQSPSGYEGDSLESGSSEALEATSDAGSQKEASE